VSDLSKLFQVDKLLRTQVRRLSLGERMKLEIIAAVLHNPKFLILDEPTIGLDVVSRRTIRDFVADLNKNHGTTVVLSSHDMIDISELCQDLVLIDQGQILFNGRLADFSKHHLAKSQDRVLALSFASANIVQADFESELALTQAQLLDWTGAGARIRVKADLTGTALAKLVGRFDFSDIRIEGPGLEEIVHGLLSKS
jgi:ABC-2 type transport system ATP-binding protein